ncbi:MAG TPA: hypothetical protein PK544_05880 [Spirochaetota bacterium]|nr:hypothetical protein [Spirochaetota bacterium]
MQTLYYIPALNTTEHIASMLSDIGPEKEILFGEYGAMLPLAAPAAGAMNGGKRFIEIILSNKNRDLAAASLVSAAQLGFDGVVIASGVFGKKEGMGKPVYDLDPSQALMLATTLRKQKTLPETFTIGIRTPTGSGAAHERARFFIENGADFLAVPEGASIPEFEDKTVIIKEYKR